jgi:hypothetical protein
MMTPTHAQAARLVSVFNEDGTCLGFVLARGLAGFEAFTADDRSLGVFPAAKQAANALLVEVGGP